MRDQVLTQDVELSKKIDAKTNQFEFNEKLLSLEKQIDAKYARAQLVTENCRKTE